MKDCQKNSSRAHAASRRAFYCAAMLLTWAVSGCSEQRIVSEEPEQPPQLELVQSGPGQVDIQISGSYGLRALQAEVSFDPQQVSVSQVEAGTDAARLDRLFYSDPTQAQGKLIVGLSDTRQVSLPARGSLIRLHLQAQGGASSATLQLKNPLGSLAGGKPVTLEPVQSEVTL